MTNRITNREGFWSSSTDPMLPTPRANDRSWVGQETFLNQLRAFEADEETVTVGYRRSSRCRICACKNGSETFFRGGWEWPSGFKHYVEAHNVSPSLAFREFINGGHFPYGPYTVEDSTVTNLIEQEDRVFLAHAESLLKGSVCQD